MRNYPASWLCSFFLLSLFACSQPAAKAPAPPSDSAAAKAFFPIADYIGGQLKLIDSFQYPVTMSFTRLGKTATSRITDQQLKELAENFRSPDINDPAIKKYYTESNFADQSIPAITFAYSCTREGLPLRKATVIVKPDPLKSDKVNSIYMEKSFMRADTLVSQKLFWVADKSFSIVTDKRIGIQAFAEELVKIVWDPN